MSEQLHEMLSALVHTPGDESTLAAIERWAADREGRDDAPATDRIEAAAGDLSKAGRHAEAVRLLTAAAGIAGGARRADLWASVGRIQEEGVYDPKRAIASYRNALEASADHPAAAEALARLEKLASEWKRVVERLEEEAAGETEPALKSRLYLRIAGLVESFGGKQKDRAAQVIAHLQNALRASPSNHAAVQLLIRVMDRAKRLDDLAPQLAQLASEAKVRDEKVALLLEGAKIYARLEQPDKAARLYQEVLDFVPGHPTALSFLVDYFTALNDSDHLVALYEDALRARPRGESELELLFQIGMVHWKMRGDAQAAEEYFRRIRKHNTAHPAALNFYRGFLRETRDYNRLLQILLEAQRAAETDDERIRFHWEIAGMAERDLGNDERAIEALKGILKIRPDDPDAAADLRRLYEKTGKWNALVDLLKTTLAGIPDDEPGRKVDVLLDMVRIYADHLKSDMMVIKTYFQILGIDPMHAGAFEALLRAFEEAKRWNDLIGLLNKRAEQTADVAEKKALYRRIADTWIRELNNYNNALRPLEQLREIDPADADAVRQLKDIYARRRAFPQLYDLLVAELPGLEGEQRIEQMVEIAQLAGDRLDRRDEAVKLWWEIADLDPTRPGVLDTIQKLAERAKDWNALARVLEKRIEAEGDAAARVQLLVKLAGLYQEKLADPVKASDAYRRVLAIQPGHHKATRMLKETFLAAGDYPALEELYQSLGDWEGLVEALGVAADRVADRGLRVELSFKAAAIYEDRIGQPDRAFRAYERVLDADPGNRRAAGALAGIYERQENWNALANVLGVLADLADGASEKLGLSRRLMDILRDKIGDKPAAFEWAKRCYALAPRDEDVVAALELQAEDLKRFDDLLKLFETRLSEAKGEERVGLLRRIADIQALKLGDVDAAVEAYGSLLRQRPEDLDVVVSLERLLQSSGKLEMLADFYRERLDAAETDEDTRVWLGKLAQLLDEGLDRTDEAIATYRRILDMDADDAGALDALERIYAAANDAPHLADVLVRKRALAGGDARRELTFRLGELYAGPLARPDAAVEAFEEVLGEEPGREDAVAALERFLQDADRRLEVAKFLVPIYESAKQFPKLAWALQIVVEGIPEGVERLERICRLASVYEGPLADPDAAFRTLSAAVGEFPQEERLWVDLGRLAEAVRDHRGEAERLEEVFESNRLTADASLRLARRLAHLWDKVVGDQKRAERFYRRIFDADPDDADAYVALDALLKSEERYDDLAAVLRDRADRTASDDTRVDMLQQLAFLLEDVLEKAPEAIATYREIVEIRPEHEVAIRSLEGLYERQERWEDLVALLERTAGVMAHEAESDRRLRVAELRETRLDQKSAALDDYRGILAERPDEPRVLAALERLLGAEDLRQEVADLLAPVYEKQGRYSDLVRILRVKLEAAATAGDRLMIWTRIAQIREDALGDLDGAFEAYSQAIEAEPADPDARRELARIADAKGLHSLLADVLEGVLEKVADDAVLRAELLSKLARLYDEALAEPDKAEGAYRRWLEVDPDDPGVAVPAAAALERIYAAREQHAALVEVLRIQARFAEQAEHRVGLLRRVAEIQETFLSSAADALATLEEVDDIVPTDVDNVRALERLYEQTARWSKLVDTLRRRSAMVSDPAERRAVAYRIAQLVEEKLDDRDEAVSTYQNILADTPGDVAAVHALIRLFGASEQWADLLDAQRRLLELVTTDGERVDVLRGMGDVQHGKLGDAVEAVESYRRAIEIDPRHGPSREALERLTADEDVRLAAARILAGLYEREGRYADLLRLLDIEIADAEDDIRATAVLRRAAEVAEIGLSDNRRAFDYLAQALRRIAGTGDAGGVAAETERLAGAIGDVGALTALFREVAPDVVEPTLQTSMFLRIAAAAKAEGDVAAAVEYYTKALDNDPRNRTALDGLEEVYAGAERWSELLDIYRRKADLAEAPQERVALLFLQGRLCEERLDDTASAMACYETIREIDPRSADAAAALERLYEGAERWTMLVELLEARIDWPGADALALRHRIGEIVLDRLGDPPRAFDAFRRVLDADPAYPLTRARLEALLGEGEHRSEAADVLEDVYRRQMDLQKLVGVLEVKLEFADDQRSRKELLRRIGQLYDEQLENMDQAIATYGRLYREDVEDEGSRELVERLAGVMGAWDRLADLYDAILRDADIETSATAAVAYRLGEIAEHKLGDLTRARGAYRRAYSFDVSNLQAMEALERVFAATEDWAALLDLLRQVADASYDAENKKRFLFQMAGIQEEKVENRARAIETYVEVLDVDPADARAIAALDRLYYYEKRWPDLADLLIRQIDQAQDDKTRNGLRYRLGVLYQEQLDDAERAVTTFEEILAGDPTYREAISALEGLMNDPDQRFRIAQTLEPVYRYLGDWESLVGVYQAQLESLADASDRILRWLEIARLYEQNGRDPRSAFGAYAEAFKEDPADSAVLEQLQRLAGSLDAWNDLIPTIEAGIAKVDDAVLKADLLRLIARTLDRRLGDFRAAAAAYERLIALEPSDMEAVDGLDALLTLLADWERLIAVLDMKADLGGDMSALKTIRQRQGEICEDQLGRLDAAIDFYRKALDLDEADLHLYDAIAKLLERKERYEELVEILRRKLTVLQEPAGRRDALVRSAVVVRDKMGDAAEAIRAYQALLEEFPGDLEALDALDALYTGERAWHDLLDVLVRRLDVAATDGERLVLRLRLGNIARERLEDAEGAIDHFEQALALAPDNEEAVGALVDIAGQEEYRLRIFDVVEPVLRRKGRWDQLLALRESKLLVIDDPAARVEELGRIADLCERALNRPAEAFAAYLRAVREEAPSEDAIMNAERLAEQLDGWRDLVDALRVKAKATADAAAAGALWRSVGAVCEGRLGDVDGAVDAYRAALDATPDDSGPLDALDRLYARLERWDDLVDVLLRKMDLAGDPVDQSGIEMRIARLRIDRYEDVAAAIAAARSVIERTPDDTEAPAFLESLVSHGDHLPALVEILGPVYRARGEYRKLLDLMEARVAGIDDPDDRTAMLRDMAVLAEEDLRDPASAFRALSRAFEVSPEEPGLLEDLERLGDVLAAWGPLGELAATAAAKVSDPDRKTQLLSRCGKWAVRTGDDEKAVAAYRAVLEIEPDRDEALHELEEALRRLDRAADLADVIERRAALIYDPEEKKSLYRTLAGLSVERLGDRKRAAEAYDKILEADEADLDAMDAAISLRQELEEWPTLVALLRRRLAVTPDIGPANEIRRRIGMLCLGPLEEERDGLDSFKEILEFQPDDAETIAVLEDFYTKKERWDDLRDLIRDRLDRAAQPAARIGLLRRLSELAEHRLESPDDALDYTMQILDYDRGNAWAKSRAEHLLASLERWDDLVMQLETWLREAQETDQAEEMRLLVRIGEIRETHMDDPDSAVEYYEKVLAREPNHALALAALARIHERKEDWPKAVEALERAAQGGGSPADISEIFLRLGAVKHKRLDDAAGALYNYQQAVQADPESRKAVDAVLDLAKETEQWPTWAAYAEYAARFAPEGRERAAALLDVAKVQADKLGDSAKATQLLEAARAIAPDDIAVLMAVADRYTADGRTEEAIPILEHLIEQDAAGGGRRRSKESAVYVHRLAKALEAKGDVEGAIERLEDAAKIDVTNIEVAFALGRLYYRQNVIDKAMQKLRPLLLQKIEPSSGIDKADVYWMLAKMHIEKGEKPKAVSMLDRGLQANPDHEGCKALAAELK